MKRKIIILLIMSMCIFLLAGCWDSKDINRKSITISIGVDYVDNNIELSGEIAKLEAYNKESGKSNGSDVYKILGRGKTIEKARENFEASNPLSTFLGATRVVVFGENYAKQGLRSYFSRIDHLYDYRKTLLAAVSREQVKEIFDVEVEKDISAGFLIEDIIEELIFNGKGLYPVVGNILSDIEFGNIGYLLPYMGIEEGSIKYLGLAVMKDSKFIGNIDMKDSYGIIYVLAKKPKVTQVINSNANEKNNISFQTFVKRRKIKTDYIDGKVVIGINLDLKAQLTYQEYIEPISNEYIEILEETISEKVKDEIKSVIKRAQNDFICDFFGFARYFRADNPEIFEKIKWEDAFTKADIKVNVKTKIINKSLSDPNAKKKY